MKIFDHTIDGSVKQKVQQILAWDDMRYASYQERCGQRYLECLMPDYPQVVRQITGTRIYWQWWIRHWENRDKEFIEMYENCQGQIDAADVYQEMNDPRTLAIAIYLNGQVLSESYAVMIGEVTRKQTQKPEPVCL